MRHAIPILFLALATAACHGGEVATTTATLPGPVTTTTAAPVACNQVADRAVELLRDMVDALDEIPFDVLADKDGWPEELVRLDERGNALQAESDAAGCDEGVIRGAVVAAAAEMEAEGRIARYLLDLLAP